MDQFGRIWMTIDEIWYVAWRMIMSEYGWMRYEYNDASWLGICMDKRMKEGWL